MTMHAITLRQPWAHAVAHFGKDVENRPRRPPAHLIGERVAIHVGQSRDNYGEFRHRASFDLWSVPDHLRPLYAWVNEQYDVPNAGRLVATALLVGWAANYDGEWHASCMPSMDAAQGSPWFVGPVGWVLADVRPLAVPVGQEALIGQPCDAAPFGLAVAHADRGDGLCECCGQSVRGAILGKLYPFALSPEVEAEVLRQERDHA